MKSARFAALLAFACVPAAAGPIPPETGTFCKTDTTQAQFAQGTVNGTDVVTSPGDVILAKPVAADQSQPEGGGFGYAAVNEAQWVGQTFVPGVTGTLAKIEIGMFCTDCTGTVEPITVQVRTTTGSPAIPTGTVLATTTMPGFAGDGGDVVATATFAEPALLTAGTTYAYVVGVVANPSVGTLGVLSGFGPSDYPNGNPVSSNTAGDSWIVGTRIGSTRDFMFKTFMASTTYQPSGDFVSRVNDSNPQVLVTWDSLAFVASTPAGTTVQMQAAASVNAAGPFNFVGPDGTAATFFANGASLAQFNGKQYLKTRALLATQSGVVTPELHRTTVCHTNAAQPDLSITVDDGVATATPGESVTYAIVVQNLGTTLSQNALVRDDFPASETCTWACVATAAASCAAVGSGDIEDPVVLPPGTRVTYTAFCGIASGATGAVANTATISSHFDPVPGNNAATDTDTLAPKADLSITKSDGVSAVVVGGTTTYTIVATNAGPSDAAGAVVTDAFPASETCTWTCAGTGGGTCTASGSGNIGDTVNLPVGGNVRYAADCVIATGASGTITNVASVATPAGAVDPTPASASDADQVLPIGIFGHGFEASGAVIAVLWIDDAKSAHVDDSGALALDIGLLSNAGDARPLMSLQASDGAEIASIEVRAGQSLEVRLHARSVAGSRTSSAWVEVSRDEPLWTLEVGDGIALQVGSERVVVPVHSHQPIDSLLIVGPDSARRVSVNAH